MKIIRLMLMFCLFCFLSGEDINEVIKNKEIKDWLVNVCKNVNVKKSFYEESLNIKREPAFSQEKSNPDKFNKYNKSNDFCIHIELNVELKNKDGKIEIVEVIPDSSVYLEDCNKNIFIQLFYYGASGVIYNAFWHTNSKIVIYGIEKSDTENKPMGMICLVDIKKIQKKFIM